MNCRPRPQSPPSIKFPTTPSSMTEKLTMTSTKPAIAKKQYPVLKAGTFRCQHHRYISQSIPQHRLSPVPLALSQWHSQHSLQLLHHRQHHHLHQRHDHRLQSLRHWRHRSHHQRPEPRPSHHHLRLHWNHWQRRCSIAEYRVSSDCRY